jgi:hypothetical protein
VANVAPALYGTIKLATDQFPDAQCTNSTVNAQGAAVASDVTVSSGTEAGTCQLNYTGPDGYGGTNLNPNDLLLPGPGPLDLDLLTKTLTFTFTLINGIDIYTQAFVLYLMPSP